MRGEISGENGTGVGAQERERGVVGEFQSVAKNPGLADALIFGATGLGRGRAVVEGAMVGAEKDPGFFAALRMTKEAAASLFPSQCRLPEALGSRSERND